MTHGHAAPLQRLHEAGAGEELDPATIDDEVDHMARLANTWGAHRPTVVPVGRVTPSRKAAP